MGHATLGHTENTFVKCSLWSVFWWIVDYLCRIRVRLGFILLLSVSNHLFWFPLFGCLWIRYIGVNNNKYVNNIYFCVLYYVCVPGSQLFQSFVSCVLLKLWHLFMNLVLSWTKRRWVLEQEQVRGSERVQKNSKIGNVYRSVYL